MSDKTKGTLSNASAVFARRRRLPRPDATQFRVKGAPLTGVMTSRRPLPSVVKPKGPGSRRKPEAVQDATPKAKQRAKPRGGAKGKTKGKTEGNTKRKTKGKATRSDDEEGSQVFEWAGGLDDLPPNAPSLLSPRSQRLQVNDDYLAFWSEDQMRAVEQAEVDASILHRRRSTRPRGEPRGFFKLPEDRV